MKDKSVWISGLERSWLSTHIVPLQLLQHSFNGKEPLNLYHFENIVQNKTITHFSLVFPEFPVSACNLAASHHVRCWEKRAMSLDAYFSFWIPNSDFHQVCLERTIRSQTTSQTNGFHELKIKQNRSNIPSSTHKTVTLAWSVECNSSTWSYPNR